MEATKMQKHIKQMIVLNAIICFVAGFLSVDALYAEQYMQAGIFALAGIVSCIAGMLASDKLE